VPFYIQKHPIQPTLSEVYGGGCYAAQAGEGGYVKVGYSRIAALSRVHALQQASPFKIALIAAWRGFKEDERQAHIALTPYRFRNEWYHPHPAVFAYVSAAAERAKVVMADEQGMIAAARAGAKPHVLRPDVFPAPATEKQG